MYQTHMISKFPFFSFKISLPPPPHTVGYFKESGGGLTGFSHNTPISLVFHGENEQKENILIIFLFTNIVSIVLALIYNDFNL